MLPRELTAEELRRLLEAATPRPWHAQRVGPWSRGAIVDERQTELCDYPYERSVDARLMAAAVNSLGNLLDAAEERVRLRARVRELEEALRPFAKAADNIERFYGPDHRLLDDELFAGRYRDDTCEVDCPVAAMFTARAALAICTGCGASDCSHLWTSQRKCCQDCSHGCPSPVR